VSETRRWGYRGYVSCREFGGLRMPVPVQTIVLRDYCARHGLVYKLHVNENEFPHSYMVLEGMLDALDGLEGILVFSMFMLPKRAERRRKVYQRILETGIELHLVLEDFVIREAADVRPVEEILSARALLALCPTRIPGELRIGL
jgi:sporadic carbohydrate cluster protein (TIGR04323 family)